MITSTFAAEYGRGGTSQVNVVTRGGTRRFRGSLYEFLRNDALDARDYLTHQVLPLKLNNFGYNIHGPLVLPGYNKSRLKTFFFWTQEFNIIKTRGAAINTTVPDVAQRNGDFSGLGPGRDGAFGTADDPVIDPLGDGFGFPDGRIPPSRINPLANVGKITKPMLVMQGANDPRVPKSESDQVVAKLRENGVETWYVVFADEGHGFLKKPNNDLRREVETVFLRRLFEGK